MIEASFKSTPGVLITQKTPTAEQQVPGEVKGAQSMRLCGFLALRCMIGKMLRIYVAYYLHQAMISPQRERHLHAGAEGANLHIYIFYVVKWSMKRQPNQDSSDLYRTH